jgi:hypothetical protein
LVSFSFLVDLEVLKREVIPGVERFLPAKFWRAEDSIVSCLNDLIDRAELEQENLQLDIDGK